MEYVLTNVVKHRVNTATLWINAVCTQHAERRKKTLSSLVREVSEI